jgi:AcrR family transcriptional regulator
MNWRQWLHHVFGARCVRHPLHLGRRFDRCWFEFRSIAVRRITFATRGQLFINVYRSVRIFALDILSSTIYLPVGMKVGNSTPQIGRPRAFNPEVALEKALQVFWRRGYAGASLSELTAAMGITRPSLYATFGNKEELFHKALDLYIGGPANGTSEALQKKTARDVVEHLLNRLVALLSDPHHPAGCLLVKGGLSSGKADESIRDEMSKRRLAGEDALRERFERAKAEGDLPAYGDPAGLAFYVTTITQGLTVQAVNGTDETELRRLVEMVLQTWPKLVESSASAGR